MRDITLDNIECTGKVLRENRRMRNTPQVLDLDLLRTLVAVVRDQSFTVAARSLQQTQSAVSMQMRRLEDLMGQTLVERGRAGVFPTADGRRLMEVATEMLMLNDRAFASESVDQVTGPIRVGAIEQYARDVLPRVVADFSRKYPGVSVEVQTEMSSVMRTRLGSAYDLVITIGAAGTQDGTVLERSPAVWATSKQHEAHLQTPVPLALQVEGPLLRTWATAALESAGRRWRIAYSSSSMAAMEAAVVAGLAVGVFKRDTVSSRMKTLSEAEGFPTLPLADVVIALRTFPSRGTALLADHIVRSTKARAVMTSSRQRS